MFRWLSCCCLILGMTALARENSAPGRPVEEQSPTPAPPIFGMQVQVGLDGTIQPSRRKNQTVSPVSHFDVPAETEGDPDAGRLKLAEWQEPDEVMNFEPVEEECYTWQILPAGLMYKAYLAGEKESRMAAVWMRPNGRDGVLWECALGGHVGLLRYGNTDAITPEGWQLDLEGAALPRVDMGHNDDLEACDYRAGFLSTWRFGVNAYKAGYYHLSSHAGDEFLIRNPTFTRINYVRDSFIVGWTRHLTPDAQAYGEIAYAWNCEDGAEPLELQYGVQYSPMVFGFRGAPFAAINGHTRQDFGWITSVNVNAGWQWRGSTNHIWRFGLQYYTGPAMQWEFAGSRETMLGGGMWMDY